MRKLAIAVALSSTLLATPAFARNGAWYIGGDFGAMIVEDTHVNVGGNSNTFDISHHYGYDGDINVGYDLGRFRIEAEGAYKRADLDNIINSIGLPGQGPTWPSQSRLGGHAAALSFMLNGLIDFGDDNGISGFLGGGVGIARVEYKDARVFTNQGPAFADDSDTRFAWQLEAGVRQAVTDNIDITLKYRFFNVPNVRLTAFNGQEAKLRYR